jgi:hypothetical protein
MYVRCGLARISAYTCYSSTTLYETRHYSFTFALRVFVLCFLEPCRDIDLRLSRLAVTTCCVTWTAQAISEFQQHLHYRLAITIKTTKTGSYSRTFLWRERTKIKVACYSIVWVQPCNFCFVLVCLDLRNTCSGEFLVFFSISNKVREILP